MRQSPRVGRSALTPVIQVARRAFFCTLVVLAVGCGGSSATETTLSGGTPTGSTESAPSEDEWRELWDGTSSAFLPKLRADVNDLVSIGTAVQEEGWSVLSQYGDGWYVSLRGLKTCSENLLSLGAPPTPALEEASALMLEACAQYEEAAAMLEAQRGGETAVLSEEIFPVMKAADALRKKAIAAADAA
jgi:hypothetical protein